MICNCEHEITSWHCDTSQERIELEDYLQAANAVWPSTYFGDWIIDGNSWKPQAMCKVGDIVYITASRPSGIADDMGMVWAFNTTASVNTLVAGFPKQFTLGHANSICFDENEKAFYIVAATMTSGEKNSVFKFNENFDYVKTIYCPLFVPFAITFDHVNKVTYVMGRRKNVEYPIAKVSHDEFEEAGVFTLPQPSQAVGEFLFNQDFAVHGDLAIITSPYGAAAVGSMKRKEIYAYKTIAPTDLESARWLGETEGMEFDSDGLLFCARDTKLTFTSNDVDMMVTVINYKELAMRPVYSFESNDFTFNINNATVNQFRNWYATLKHPNQINMFANKDTVYKLNINTDAQLGVLSFGVPVGLMITKLNCSQIRFRTGNNFIMAGAASSVMNFTNSTNPIALEEGAQFSLDNNTNFILSTNLDTLNIAVGYQHPIISLGVRVYNSGAPVNVTIGDQSITNPIGLYWRHRLIATEA